jgi:hypothetical protein
MKFLRISFFFLYVIPFTYAQNVNVTATVDSSSIVIGDWMHVSVEVKHPSNIKIVFPALRDTIGPFEIVKQDSLQRTEENGITTLSKVYTISSYHDGMKYVPPISVEYRTESDTTLRIAESNPIPVTIRGIEVDTSQTIRDIKPPLSVPISLEEILLYIGIVVVIAAVGYFIYQQIQKKKRALGEIVEEKPLIPPHILAFQKLEELEVRRLWQAGEIKVFYSLATEIVRTYFEQRYGIMALEMTTGEVMMQLQKFKMEKSLSSFIELFLSSADLVKFAKYQPVVVENEQVISQARMIVEKTIPVQTITEEQPAEVNQNV